ncbi:UNVERIFIED_CONTAM: hypothetical protein Scaly_3007600 [Sesamum calycinum]|uniref:Reverse transcriptase Ty1/copia-type domain-containing protein n=1 Tax=Sesamum calycinum TaxID=2727403 RepID=A0AAW2KCY4_9LAMI
MSNINSRIWIKATKSEMDSMTSNNVWTLVDPPKGVKPVGYKWVYKRKLGADGEMDMKMAFLNEFVEEEIYMDQSEGFTSVGEEQKVCHLQRSIMVSNKLPGAGISVLMRSYEVMISSRANLTLVYTRRFQVRLPTS